MKFTLKEIILIGIFAALTAVFAQISIPIPISPVPITLSIFAVFLSALILGSKCGAFSQIIYVLLGTFGVPVFSGLHSGPGYILGATGGYIISYPIMAFVIGLLIDRKKTVSVLDMIGAMIIGLIICYTLGTSWLAVFTKMNAAKAISLGIVPYLPLDILKTVAAALIGYQTRATLLRANLIIEKTKVLK